MAKNRTSKGVISSSLYELTLQCLGPALREHAFPHRLASDACLSLTPVDQKQSQKYKPTASLRIFDGNIHSVHCCCSFNVVLFRGMRKETKEREHGEIVRSGHRLISSLAVKLHQNHLHLCPFRNPQQNILSIQPICFWAIEYVSHFFTCCYAQASKQKNNGCIE